MKFIPPTSPRGQALLAEIDAAAARRTPLEHAKAVLACVPAAGEAASTFARRRQVVEHAAARVLAEAVLGGGVPVTADPPEHAKVTEILKMTAAPSAIQRAVTRLTALLAKATPGPWTAHHGDNVISAPQPGTTDGRAVIVAQALSSTLGATQKEHSDYDLIAAAARSQRDANADLIVEAVNALPLLLASVRALAPPGGEASKTQQHGARLFELVGLIHKTVRGDALGECWTIRHWLDSQGQFNDDISGKDRLIEIACAHALAKWPVTEKTT